MEKLNNILTGFVSNILGNIIMFVTTIFLTQFIEPNIYGEFRFVFAFVSLMVIVLLLGRDSGLIYYSQNKELDKNILANQEVFFGFLVLLLGTFMLYIFKDFIILNFFSSHITTEHYQFALLMIPLWGLFNLYLAVIKVNNMMNYSFVLQNLIQRAIRLPFFILFILVSSSYYSLVASMIVSQILLLYVIIKKSPIKLDINKIKIRNFFLRFKYSFQLGLNTVIIVLLTQIDVLMIGKYTANENVAIYDICVLLSFIIMLPFIALVKSSEPVMQAILKEKDEREKYFKNLKLSIELSLGILLVYILSSSEILYIFGETYTNGMMAFLILSCGYMILNILGSPIEILNMNGYTKVSSFVLILSLVLNITFNYYLIPLYGIVGASIATIIALLFSKIISMIFIYRKFSFNFINFHKVYIIFPIFLYIGSLLSFDFWIYQILYSVFILIVFVLTIILNDINYKNVTKWEK